MTTSQYGLVARRLTETVRAAELVFRGCGGDPMATDPAGVQDLYDMLFVTGWAEGEPNPICTLGVHGLPRVRNTNMNNLDALKNLRAKVSGHRAETDPFDDFNRELDTLAVELGGITSSRQPSVVFRANGQDITLTMEGQKETSRFMVQSDTVGPKPFALRDAAGFVKLEAAAHIAELAAKLLEETSRGNEEIRGATATLTAVRDALKSV